MEKQTQEAELTAGIRHFILWFGALQNRAFMNAREKGFYDGPVNDGNEIALMHSELSEALELLRHGNGKSDHIGEFLGIEEELADVVIRIMSYAGAKGGLRIAEAIVAKMEFNAGRPRMHGDKLF